MSGPKVYRCRSPICRREWVRQPHEPAATNTCGCGALDVLGSGDAISRGWFGYDDETRDFSRPDFEAKTTSGTLKASPICVDDACPDAARIHVHTPASTTPYGGIDCDYCGTSVNATERHWRYASKHWHDECSPFAACGAVAIDGGKLKTAPDPVNHPPHYTLGGIEVIDAIEAWKLGFHLGNAVKYIARAGRKGDAAEDLAKARWYIDREIERLGKRGAA